MTRDDDVIDDETAQILLGARALHDLAYANWQKTHDEMVRVVVVGTLLILRVFAETPEVQKSMIDGMLKIGDIGDPELN